MAHIIKDRVLEQSTTTGLGAFTLAGAALGYRAFASVCSVSDTCWYYIEGVDSLGKPSGAYEYGTGTYSGANTLTRTTVIGSSNSGSPVDFAAGTKLVGMGVMAPGPATVNRHWRRALGLPPSVTDFGATGDGTTDDTAAIQAAIDSLTSGGELFFPPAAVAYEVTGLRIDGSGGTLTDITLRGCGPSSEIRIKASNTSNVIKALAGSGFRLTGLRIRGGLGRGVTAVAAPSRGLWVAGTAYTAGDTVEVSSTDTATTTVAASNLVYECTSSHTASALFLTDKAGKWTASAVANLNTVDISYGTRNNVYLDGVVNCTVDNCELLDSVYAGVNVGTGPVQAANAGTGSAHVRVQENFFDNCTNGVAGGKMTYCVFDANTMKSCVTYGIVIDDPASSGNAVTGNTITGAGSHGIYLYGADTSSVNGNTVSYCGGVGILFDSAAVGNPIVGNVCNNNLQGIRAYNSTISSVVGNTCRANTQYGISMELVSQVAMGSNTCESNGYDGIRLTSCTGFALNGNTCSTNDGVGGIYLTGCSTGSINGGTYLNNNDSASPDADGAGIRIIDSTTISVSGISAYDSRSGGSKTQKYGVRSTGTSDAIKLAGNSLTGNATGQYALVGSNNRVSIDIGDKVAASSAAAFSATHYATCLMPDGTTGYIAIPGGPW